VDFLLIFSRLAGDGFPLFIDVSLIISLLSILTGRKERWTVSGSLYFGFITASTVGYGEMRSTTLPRLIR